MQKIMSKYSKTTKSLNVYETFKPFYTTLKFFGFVAFHLDHKNGKVDVRWGDVLWTFIWFCGTVFLLLFNMTMGDDQIGEKSTVVRKGLLYLLCFELLACCLIIIFHFIKREKVATYLSLLQDFDDMVI